VREGETRGGTEGGWGNSGTEGGRGREWVDRQRRQREGGDRTNLRGLVVARFHNRGQLDALDPSVTEAWKDIRKTERQVRRANECLPSSSLPSLPSVLTSELVFPE
jgi:hypothetical protein